jgi:raffinose/stachyose/melibiose transport system substrate-binding protein
MKKILIWLLVLMLIISMTIAFALAGCKAAAVVETAAETTAVAETTAAETTEAAVETEPAEEILLKYYDYQGGNNGILAAFNEIIKIFEEENPGVKVEYKQYTVTTYNEFLKPAISGGSAPDMFAIYAGPDVVDIAGAGALRDLTPDIDDEWKGWMGKAYNFKGIYNEGIIVHVPVDALTECVWYHKDMLKEIGWDIPEVTDAFTPEDFAAMVAPAKAKGFDVMLAGFIEPWCYFNPFFNFVHQQQPGETPDMVEEAFAGKISWQQPIFKNAFEVFVKMNSAGVWPKDALSMDYQVQAFGAWLERKSIFMWPLGDWFAGSMKPEENNYDNQNIGITQYPLVNSNSTVSFNKNFGSSIAVYSKGEHQDLAVAFARLANSPRGASIFTANGVNPACGLDTSNIPKTENPVFDECIKLYNSPGRISEIIYTYPDGVKALGDGIANVVFGLDTIDNVLKNLDEVSGFKG